MTINRRQLFSAAAGAAAVGAVGLSNSIQAEDAKGVVKGNINQSIVHWCFNAFGEKWDLDKTCQVAKQLGCKSVELIPHSDWGTLKKYGLKCAIAPSHLFMQGMNNPRYQKQCIAMIKESIDASKDAGNPTVISFTGYAQESGDWADGGNPDVTKLPKDRRIIDPDEGLKNCVAGFKEVVGYAEKKGINISLEMLNTREDTHPMKGHPGYQGDHVDYCMDIINQVGSKRFGLLFDIYHVQIMDGDIIRRIHQCGEAINHVHTAGNPGRGEIGDNQEINYAPCMKALLDIGYKGYVGQEFIPTKAPKAGLQEAVSLCDV